MRPSSHAERVFVSIAKNRHLNAFALCALRKATELLGYATGLRLAELIRFLARFFLPVFSPSTPIKAVQRSATVNTLVYL